MILYWTLSKYAIKGPDFVIYKKKNGWQGKQESLLKVIRVKDEINLSIQTVKQ